jgi:hypothetical protein
MTRRFVSSTYLAARTGFSARWFTREASKGKIPGACQPNGEKGEWRFDEQRFWQYWRERERGEPWHPSTGAARNGGDVSSVRAVNSGSPLKQRLKELRSKGFANGSTASTR